MGVLYLSLLLSLLSLSYGFRFISFGFNSKRAPSLFHYWNRPKPAVSRRLFDFGPALSVQYGDPQGKFDCYRIYPDCLLVNAAPFERRALLSSQECADLCDQKTSPQQCRSFVYNRQRRLCDLFDVAANDGSSAKLIGFKFVDYYHRKSSCETKKAQLTSSATERPTQIITPTAPPPNQPLKCSPGREPIFLRIDNHRMEISGRRTQIEAVTEEECISYCVLDQTPTEVFNCQAANYDSFSRLCEMSNEKAEPVGTNRLVKAFTRTYFEKTCVRDDHLRDCPAAAMLERIRHAAIVEGQSDHARVSSMQICIERCLDAQRNLGFVCRSLQFYPETSRENCVLNRVDHIEEPELFLENDPDEVDYISFEPCTQEFQSVKSNSSAEEAVPTFKSFPLVKGISRKIANIIKERFKPLRQLKEVKWRGAAFKRRFAHPF